MKRSSRFSRAKLARFAPLLVTAPVLALGAGGAAFVNCIPNPDISGLPPYDGGSMTTIDAGAFTEGDSATDATIIFDAGPAVDSGTVDSASPTGTVSGVVLDYAQGNGKGVIPGATVSVSVPSNAAAPYLTATTDANGVFAITGVQAGVALEVSVFKATDTSNLVAYSTASLGITVPAGQNVSVFPVLHEGCFQIVSQSDAGAIDLQTASCPFNRASTSSYASMTFGTASFDDATSGVLYGGTVRIEMIPLAYPANASDLAWAVGLPGVTTPPGLLGAAEYRVVKSNPPAGEGTDGDPLTLHSGATVSIAIPTYAAGPGGAKAYSFDTTTNAWTAETASPGLEQDAGVGAVGYVTMTVPHLTWWAAATGVAATTCVTGTIQAGGSPLANVFIHGTGVNYLGSSTGVTNSSGLFCLDVPTTAGDGGATSVELFPAAYAGGIAYGWTPQAYPITGTGAGSCALGTGCQSLGAAITLAPAVACASGNVTFSGASASSLNVVLQQLPVTDDDQNAGVRPQAYVGQTSLAADGGAFCALLPPGVQAQLQDVASGCYVPIQAPNGATANMCGGAGCYDAGTVACVSP